MSRIIPTGEQSFVTLRQDNLFYIDKTAFIKEWWTGKDQVTLITRPRRFGKTLMLDTVKTFFSPEFADKSDYFKDLKIWDDQNFRNLHGTVPVISLSFADIKEANYKNFIESIKEILIGVYRHFARLLDKSKLSDWEKDLFLSINSGMNEQTLKRSLRNLSECLTYQYKNKPIILLDEYDTPLHEAWINNYWDDVVDFMRGLFNSTFKTNPYLGRGLITGITRVAKESIFSDMNNLKVVTVTSNNYSDCFGFTEREVFDAMDEYGLTNKQEVKKWYDGFIFGDKHEIYNPWSIICFLSNKRLDTYWADSSSNSLVGELLAHSDITIKKQTECLLAGKSIVTKLNEQISFTELYIDEGAIWSLLMSAGYVKPLDVNFLKKQYKLTLTNLESRVIIEGKILNWFKELRSDNNFIEALLEDNLDDMNELMAEIAESNFSYFDMKNTVNNVRKDAESFYHGFVLGLLVTLKDRYFISSNRESGFGRYDICMYPKYKTDHGIIIEFKSIKQNKEKNLEETCANAIKQIIEKDYTNDLINHNIPKRNIYIYGFAFQGKKTLICGGRVEDLILDMTCEEKE